MPAAPPAAPTSGMLLFIRYAFMPNNLGYCGGSENEILFEHAVENRSDPRLGSMLVKFTGAVPYLRTIAAANGIGDPFDPRVVEAYWVGNELLQGVEAGDLYRSLEERFGKHLPAKLRDQVLRKPPAGAKPYHVFHVLDVYRHLETDSVAMAAMENCRISWGQVRVVDGASVTVDRQPLVLVDGKLALGEARAEKVLRAFEGRGFADDLTAGDWVSIHWGWICERLDPRRLANLQKASAAALVLANQTV
ncbi:MAG TPA: DUF6390 family protein [Acidimicrobiales bacterium]|nr:DUF6390 family protein [Acidimicrobiales bacterium]